MQATTQEILTTGRREVFKIPDSHNKVVLEGGRYTIINKKGKPISCPFSKISEFVNGIAVCTSAGRKNLITADGKVLLKNYYDWIKIDGDVVLLYKDDKVGFANSEGTVYCEPCYKTSEISSFVNGIAIITRKGKMNVINAEGKILLKQYYHSVSIDGNIIRIYHRGKFGFANTEGKVVCQPNCDFIEKFANGFARFLTGDNKWGLVNDKGKIILEPKYNYVATPGKSQVVAKRGTGYGVLDFNGNIIKPFKYSKLSIRGGKTIIFDTEEDGYTVTESYSV